MSISPGPKWGPLIVAAMYILSLVLPAVDLGPNDPPVPSGVARGWSIGVLGGLMLFLGPLQMFPVLANPMLWIGWVLLVIGRGRGAMVAGLIGILLAAGSWLQSIVLLAGFYVWFGSMIALAVAGLMRWRVKCVEPQSSTIPTIIA